MRKMHGHHESASLASANDRRSFLRLAAGLGTATVGAGLLAACGGGGDEASAAGRESAQNLGGDHL